MRFYIDETFQLPGEKKKRYIEPFYTLAATGFLEEDIPAIREFLLKNSRGRPIHGSELVRTEEGHDTLEYLIRELSPKATALVCSAAIPKHDRQGEATRAQLLRIMVNHILDMFDANKIMIERRMFGVPSSRDAIVLRSIRKQHPRLKRLDLRQTPKKSEPMLWTADLLACSYRQKHKRNNERFLDLWDVEFLVP